MGAANHSILELVADISSAIASSDDSGSVLQSCTDSLVRHLDAACARIWTLKEEQNVLELQASAGEDAPRNGPPSRVPVGQTKIGQIAQTCRPRTTNDVLNDPQIHDKEWARREGIVGFAGYPLVVDGRLVGVVALFARRRLTDTMLDILPGLANQIAVGIDRKLLQEKLRQSQKMEVIGQLTGGVAHDFNNLLTIINAYSDMISSGLPRDSLERELAQEIGLAGERAAALTRQLLAFSRKQPVEAKPLSLNAVVTETTKMLERLIGEDIELTTELDPALGTVKADFGQMEQVVLNLAVNARDAMPHGGKLTIATANIELFPQDAREHPDLCPGSYVVLAAADTGIGMDQAIRARIFEPFFTTKPLGQGTGLGLATVYAIVQQNGGCITVQSEPGQGTTFKLYLPKVKEDARASTTVASGGMQGTLHGRETILLVDDEPAIVAVVRRILQAHSYTVLEAESGKQAIRIAEDYDDAIDLLVTDMVLPGIRGPELASRITRRRPGLKVLYMSGYADDIAPRAGVAQAELQFLQKPFTPTTLARKVREVLDQDRPDGSSPVDADTSP